MRREPRRAEAAEGAAVGRDEEDRVIRVQRSARESRRRSIGAGELDQHCSPGSVVIRSRTAAVVVAVGDHDDRARRAADRLRDDILHLDATAAGNDGAETLGPDRQAVAPQLVAEPVGRSKRARETVGIVRRQLYGELLRGPAVELRQERTRQRRRPCDAEGEDEEREPDQQPRPAVEASIDRPLDRSRTCSAPLGPRRNGGHPGL